MRAAGACRSWGTKTDATVEGTGAPAGRGRNRSAGRLGTCPAGWVKYAVRSGAPHPPNDGFPGGAPAALTALVALVAPVAPVAPAAGINRPAPGPARC